MSSLVPPVRHLVLEIRYDATLRLYTSMDGIGLDFLDAYPEWERSPLTLELRSKKPRRHCFLSAHRSFFESVGFENEATEFDRAMKLFDRLHHDLQFTKVRRLGVRQWAAVGMEEPFPKLVAAAAAKLAPRADMLNQALRGRIEDVGLMLDVQTDNGWKYHLRLGPMERKQWFEVVPLDPGMFDSAEDLRAYKDKFPERLYHIDLDCFQEELAYSNVPSIVASIRQVSSEIITDLVKYMKG